MATPSEHRSDIPAGKRKRVALDPALLHAKSGKHCAKIVIKITQKDWNRWN
jgi:hypothetical protein